MKTELVIFNFFIRFPGHNVKDLSINAIPKKRSHCQHKTSYECHFCVDLNSTRFEIIDSQMMILVKLTEILPPKGFVHQK